MRYDAMVYIQHDAGPNICWIELFSEALPQSFRKIMPTVRLVLPITRHATPGNAGSSALLLKQEP